jgi:ribosome-associated protein
MGSIADNRKERDVATTRDMVRLAVRTAEGHKAKDLKTLDLRGLSSVTDYFVVCSGTSDTHVRAIAEAVREKLREKGQRPYSAEGIEEGTWVLLDFVDFVVHVFHYEKRIFYGIEELWADAKEVVFRAPAAKAPAAKTAAAKAPAARKPAAQKKAPAKAPARRRTAPAQD